MGTPSTADSNNNERLAIIKQSCCVALWGAYQSGTRIEMQYVAFDTGYSMIGSDVLSVFSDFADNCFGCDGGSGWDYTTNSGSSYTTVNPETGQGADSSGWVIGHAPTPTRIHD